MMHSTVSSEKYMLKIGMSDCGKKNESYREYLTKIRGCDVVVLGEENASALQDCDALVLTGGKDVAPELYADWPDETVQVDSARDGVEFGLIDTGVQRRLPIFGICRGLQVLNVYFGGNLIIDLEKYYGRNHRAVSEDEDRYHGVRLFESSRLRQFIKLESGQVNSAHHQAADRIGRGLKVAARADDGTVEAIESSDDLPSKIVAVQWHPERIDFESPFAHGVLDLFGSCISQKHNSENYAHGG